MITACLIVAFLCVFLTPQSATASHAGPPDVGFEFPSPGGYFLSDGQVGNPGNFVIVNDDTYAGNGVLDTVTVTITSTTTGPPGISLTLSEEDQFTPGIPDPDSGVFRNKNLLFIDGPYVFRVNSIILIDFTEAGGNVDPLSIDTLPVSIASTSRPTYTPVGVAETSITSGVFQGKVTLSKATSPGSFVKVKEGDIVTISYPFSGEFVNMLVSPTPGSGVGAIQVTVLPADTVTASYTPTGGPTVTGTTEILGSTPPGGGGGGIARPGLLPIAALAIGGGRDMTPPSFALSSLIAASLSLPDEILASILGSDPFKPIMPLHGSPTELPLTIDDDAYAISGYANTIKTSTKETGKPIQLRLVFEDATGIEHVGLYTNVPGASGEIEKSDTYIIYDEGKPLQITDPHGLFSDVKLTTSEYGSKYEFLYDITFAKPMQKSDLIVRVWDSYRNSWDTKIFDAIEVIGEPLVDNTVQLEKTSMLIPYYQVLRNMPIPDSEGNMIYYNSFGDLEHKAAHPYHTPTVYPDNVGRAERFDNGFQHATIMENIKAQQTAQTLIGNPFTEVEEKSSHVKFFYPSKVGRLDRENKDILKDVMMNEHIKATKICTKLYKTNHVND